MPPPSKARKAALRREEARRLEREASTRSAALQQTESPVVETQLVQPRGSSRSSKWRDKNKKTKKSRAVRMQPSVLKFFSVSNVDDCNIEDYERLTRICWLTDSRLVCTKQPGSNVRTPNMLGVRTVEVIQPPREVQVHLNSTRSQPPSPFAILKAPRRAPMERGFCE